MGLSSAVQWWEEWQLRVLVLSSLGIQYLLAIFAGGRRFPVRCWYRILIWLCYLGSDALAIYALATLFNRQREQQYKFAQGSRDLEVLWAPILLVHLGGQVFITAYNLEDNELWRRHIVTAISQITVALYVFCKSWSSSADKRLLATSILLFILGITKCIEKSLSLKSASFNSLASDSDQAQRTPTTNREKELEEYVQEARAIILAYFSDPPPELHGDTEVNMEQFTLPDKLFVDSAYPYSFRITSLKSFFGLDEQIAYDTLTTGLTNIFKLLYTKFPIGGRLVFKRGAFFYYEFTYWVTLVVSIVAIGLFHSSHKKSYSSSDVKVSLVLLYGTFLLDIFSLLALASLFDVARGVSSLSHLDFVAQHSLIGFFSSYKSCMMCICFMVPMDHRKPCYSSREITNIIRGYVIDGWKNYITDATSYQEFSDLRGQWKLEREECDEHLGWSLEKPFDESILLWHLATDFCFHHRDKSSDHKCANRCREISNYMMHLLFTNPEMLMPGSRRNLFKTACNQLEHILKGDDSSLDEKKLTEKIIDKVKPKELEHILEGEDSSLDEKKHTEKIINKVKSTKGSEESFIHDAWVLAEGLMDLGDDTKMWEVIQGVWVEMLCFSASRCRGYLHAQSLGKGVEYLSYVWLLLAHAGMETLPERLQRPHKLRLSKEKTKHIQNVGEDAAAPSPSQGMELPEEEENNAGPSASQVSALRREEETTAAPSASQGEGTVPGLDEIVVTQ